MAHHVQGAQPQPGSARVQAGPRLDVAGDTLTAEGDVANDRCVGGNLSSSPRPGDRAGGCGGRSREGGGAGDDGQVPLLAAAEPFGDLLLVGGGVLVAVGGGGDLLAGQAGEDGPAAVSVSEGLAEGGVGHDVLRRWGRVWPQRVVSVVSWAARAGRMRAWYSAWADSVRGVRSGWRYART